jgi:hypothetical protein
MGRQRITTMAALAGLCLLCVFAAPAGASSTLLSGYGGPGEGNQALLGSTLIGGGGSGGGSGSGASSSSSSVSSIALPQGSSAGSSKAGAGRAAAPRGAKPSRAGNASKAAAPAYVTSTASATGAGGGRTLGLTGADLLYIVLAFGALVLTAAVTARFARSTGGAGRTQ